MKKFMITAAKSLGFFILWAACAGLGELPGEDPAVWRLGAELFPLLWILLATWLFLRIEKGKLKIPVKPQFWRGASIGGAVGLLWIGGAVGILWVLGALEIGKGPVVDSLPIWILAALLNTVMQELLVRGYLYQLIKREYSGLAAALVTTALFTLMHGGAVEAGLIPVLNVVTMSLFMTALMEATGTLAAPILAHGIWNCVGGILLGCVSLAEDYPSLLLTRAFGPELISGGACRVEGSIVVLFLNCLLGFLFWRKAKADSRTSD